MNNDIDRYKGSHYVLLTLERNTKLENACSFSADLIRHLPYYQALQKSSKLMFYGEVMNGPAVCLILSVNSSDDFEQIVMNDPALKSGAFRIKDVVPFINNGIMSMVQHNYHLYPAFCTDEDQKSREQK